MLRRHSIFTAGNGRYSDTVRELKSTLNIKLGKQKIICTFSDLGRVALCLTQRLPNKLSG